MNKVQIKINKNSIEGLSTHYGKFLGQPSLVGFSKASCEISLVKDLAKGKRIFNQSFNIELKMNSKKMEKPFKQPFSYNFDMVKVIDEIEDVNKPLKASFEFTNIGDKHVLLIENE